MKNYISNLRNLATYAVILIHSTSPYVADFKHVDRSEWLITTGIATLFRFCVPAFLMISGALFLGFDEPIKIFIKKRLKRVIIPFIIWNFIYFTYHATQLDYPFNKLIIYFLASFKAGESFHFWYIYVIIGIYLFIPILRKWTVTATKKDLQYFLVIWGITLLLNKYTINFFPEIELIYFSKYLGFLVLGYYLDRYPPKYAVATGSSLYLISSIVTFALTAFLSEKNNGFDETFSGYLTLNIALQSVGIFLIFKKLMTRSTVISRLADSLSYGIYLVHMLVLYAIQYIFSSLLYPVSVKVIIISIIAYTVSLIIIYLVTRIKFLRKIIT